MKIKTATTVALLLLSLPAFLIAQDRVLVISGGGARGAWGGGLAQALHDSGKDYRAVIGTSTGSLLAPMVVIDSFSRLEEAYTHVTHKDIFNVRPFYTKGRKKGQVRGFNAFWRIITGRKTLGESKRLRKTIMTYFTEAEFNAITQSPDSLEVIATIVNLQADSVEYKSSRDFGYEQMVDWIWASANQPVFMSLYKFRDEQGERDYYADGGVKENVPIRQAIMKAREIGASEIDVIIHSTDRPQLDPMQKLRVLKLLARTIDLFSTEVRENDVDIARLLGRVTELGQLSEEVE
ncbi:MAG: patatin-like phospholipase family protein, partial [Phaeodactylibacter sp.]|nr:patatin-like phospholipase family protein [Phaeodactylibacter sp.]